MYLVSVSGAENVTLTQKYNDRIVANYSLNMFNSANLKGQKKKNTNVGKEM